MTNIGIRIICPDWSWPPIGSSIVAWHAVITVLMQMFPLQGFSGRQIIVMALIFFSKHIFIATSEKIGITFSTGFNKKNPAPIVFLFVYTFLPSSSVAFPFYTHRVFSVVFVLLAANRAPSEWKSDTTAGEDSGALLANGIIFSHVTMILWAERFSNVDVLVPFPKFDMNVSADLGAYIKKLGSLWSHSIWQCHLDYSSNFDTNDSTFDFDWLLHQVRNEVRLAKQHFIALRNYTPSFLMRT